MKKRVTQAQKDLLDKLDKELEGGARDVYQAMLKQLEGHLAAQKLEQLCGTSESVVQLVNYDSSFDDRDDELKLYSRNSKITDANFKTADVLKWFESGIAQHEFRVYRPIRSISSKKMIALMKKDGYRPATALELLEYYTVQLLAAQITEWFVLVALGTVWQGAVVCLNLNMVNHDLCLFSFGDLYKHYECLAVREFF